MIRAVTNLNNNFKKNKWMYILTTLFLCIGFVLGVYTVFYMGSGVKSDLGKYLQNFVLEIQKEDVNYAALIIHSIKSNILMFLVLFCVGLLSIGGPIILIILLLKGYALGFTFALITNLLHAKGIGISIIALVPQNLIFIPCIIIFSSIVLQVSICKLKSKFGQPFDVKQNVLGALNVLILVTIFLGVGVLIESFITPNILKIMI